MEELIRETVSVLYDCEGWEVVGKIFLMTAVSQSVVPAGMVMEEPPVSTRKVLKNWTISIKFALDLMMHIFYKIKLFF